MGQIITKSRKVSYSSRLLWNSNGEWQDKLFNCKNGILLGYDEEEQTNVTINLKTSKLILFECADEFILRLNLFKITSEHDESHIFAAWSGEEHKSWIETLSYTIHNDNIVVDYITMGDEQNVEDEMLEEQIIPYERALENERVRALKNHHKLKKKKSYKRSTIHEFRNNECVNDDEKERRATSIGVMKRSLSLPTYQCDDSTQELRVAQCLPNYLENIRNHTSSTPSARISYSPRYSISLLHREIPRNDIFMPENENTLISRNNDVPNDSNKNERFQSLISSGNKENVEQENPFGNDGGVTHENSNNNEGGCKRQGIVTSGSTKNNHNSDEQRNDVEIPRKNVNKTKRRHMSINLHRNLQALSSVNTEFKMNDTWVRNNRKDSINSEGDITSESIITTDNQREEARIMVPSRKKTSKLKRRPMSMILHKTDKGLLSTNAKCSDIDTSAKEESYLQLPSKRFEIGVHETGNVKSNRNGKQTDVRSTTLPELLKDLREHKYSDTTSLTTLSSSNPLITDSDLNHTFEDIDQHIKAKPSTVSSEDEAGGENNTLRRKSFEATIWELTLLRKRRNSLNLEKDDIENRIKEATKKAPGDLSQINMVHQGDSLGARLAQIHQEIKKIDQKMNCESTTNLNMTTTDTAFKKRKISTAASIKAYYLITKMRNIKITQEEI